MSGDGRLSAGIVALETTPVALRKVDAFWKPVPRPVSRRTVPISKETSGSRSRWTVKDPKLWPKNEMTPMVKTPAAPTPTIDHMMAFRLRALTKLGVGVSI